VPKGFGGSRHGQELASLLDAALSVPDRQPQPSERPAAITNASGPTVELLKVLLRQAAERHEVAARLIATTSDIEAIASDDDADVAALKGWRRVVFGEHALALKQGKIALGLSKGRVAIVDAAGGED
jgi:ribonuclease D